MTMLKNNWLAAAHGPRSAVIRKKQNLALRSEKIEGERVYQI